MAGALVQAPTPTDAGASTSLNRTFGSTPTTGNLITAHAAIWRGSGTTNMTVADNKGNTYSYITAEIDYAANVSMRGAYATNITTSATHTVTATYDNAGNASFGCAEWSGIETSPTVSTNSGTGSSTTPSAGAITPGATSLIVGCCTYDGSATTIAVGSTYSQAFEADENNDNQAENVEYKASVTGSNTATWTLGASRAWGAYAATFTEAGGGGGAVASRLTLLGVG